MSKTRDEWIEWFTSDAEIQNYHVGDDTVLVSFFYLIKIKI